MLRPFLKGNVLRVMRRLPKANMGRRSMMLPAVSVTILRNGTRQYRISKIKLKRRAANIGTSGLSRARKVPLCRVSGNHKEGPSGVHRFPLCCTTCPLLPPRKFHDGQLQTYAQMGLSLSIAILLVCDLECVSLHRCSSCGSLHTASASEAGLIGFHPC